MSAFETFRVGSFVVELHYDSDPESPRQWDNLASLWTFERGNFSPDNVPNSDPRQALESLAADLFGNGRDFEALTDSALLALIERRAVILPIYKFDHSAVAYSCSQFSCPWDSGQVGFAFISRADILANWGGKRLTKALRAKAETAIRGEVQTYSEYASGEVYGYQIHTASDLTDESDLTHEGDSVDSCWGFYGLQYATDEARGMAEYLAKHSKPVTNADSLAAPAI